jgi:hypothetical protein
LEDVTFEGCGIGIQLSGGRMFATTLDFIDTAVAVDAKNAADITVFELNHHPARTR